MVLRRNRDLSERMKGGRGGFEGQKIKHNAGGRCELLGYRPRLARYHAIASGPCISASVTVPQPCTLSWGAMTPTAHGRHCAACQQTVVDFTLKTDAEILAYLAGAAGRATCGRFAAGQLERPLQRAAPAAPARWRAWLAAVVAVWGLRATSSEQAQAQTPTEWRARYWGGPAPAAPPAGQAVIFEDSTAAVVLRGVVLDSTSGEGLPGATVLIRGTAIGVSTGRGGSFGLPVPARLAVPSGVVVSVSSVGYVTQLRRLTVDAAAPTFRLQADVKGLMGEIIVGAVQAKPWPWHPRRFYYWGKYWVTRPFRGQ